MIKIGMYIALMVGFISSQAQSNLKENRFEGYIINAEGVKKTGIIEVDDIHHPWTFQENVKFFEKSLLSKSRVKREQKMLCLPGEIIEFGIPGRKFLHVYYYIKGEKEDNVIKSTLGRIKGDKNTDFFAEVVKEDKLTLLKFYLPPPVPEPKKQKKSKKRSEPEVVSAQEETKERDERDDKTDRKEQESGKESGYESKFESTNKIAHKPLAEPEEEEIEEVVEEESEEVSEEKLLKYIETSKTTYDMLLSRQGEKAKPIQEVNFKNFFKDCAPVLSKYEAGQYQIKPEKSLKSKFKPKHISGPALEAAANEIWTDFSTNCGK